MKCKDVTSQIDLGEIPTGKISRFRFNIHIFLCKACKYYLDGSAILRRAIRELVKTGERSIDIKKLNESLIKKHSKNNGT